MSDILKEAREFFGPRHAPDPECAPEAREALRERLTHAASLPHEWDYPDGEVRISGRLWSQLLIDLAALLSEPDAPGGERTRLSRAELERAYEAAAADPVWRAEQRARTAAWDATSADGLRERPGGEREPAPNEVALAADLAEWCDERAREASRRVEEILKQGPSWGADDEAQAEKESFEDCAHLLRRFVVRPAAEPEAP